MEPIGKIELIDLCRVTAIYMLLVLATNFKKHGKLHTHAYTHKT